MSLREIFAFIFSSMIGVGGMFALTGRPVFAEVGVVTLGITQLIVFAMLAAYKRWHISVRITRKV